MRSFCIFVVVLLLAGGITSVNADATPGTPASQPSAYAAGSGNTAMDPNRLTFGIYFNPLGFVFMGPMVGAEFTIKSFIADIHYRFPQFGLLMRLIESGVDYWDNCTMDGGVGLGIGLKYFLHTRTGGFYAGGFFEFSQYQAIYKYDNRDFKDRAEVTALAFGANLGYKFAWSHVYLRLGAYLGAGIPTESKIEEISGHRERSKDVFPFVIPDLALGISF